MQRTIIMSEPNKPEMPKQRGWSSWSDFRQTQIIFTAISSLITIATIILGAVIKPSIYSILGYVGIYVMIPAMAIVRFFGWEAYCFGQGKGVEERFFCVMILANALLGFLFGTLVGLPLACSAKKK